ncbi:MAG: MFS transporter [Chrysiogenetes bacterium]|nr:MFS transporter [Chrysiogenetes bacterium]
MIDNQSIVTQANEKKPWLTRNVLALGIVSLLTDSATEMIVPFLPLFLTGVLGASAMAVGVLEGVADAVSSIFKYFSGRWSDRSGRRFPFIAWGYGLASAARPLTALAQVPWHVIAARTADRIGKGLRSSPRDALLAGSVEERAQGRAFGFHRAMDHAGAVIGPLMAWAVLSFWTRDLRTLFWLSAIPGALAVTAVFAGVREKALVRASAPRIAPEAFLTRPGRDLVRLLIPLGLFTLGNASDLFLLLKAGATRTPMESLPLLWMALHVVKSAVSIPGGRLVDSCGARRTLALGWCFYVLIYVAFAFARTHTEVSILFVAYGIFHGLTESAQTTLVARSVNAEERGTAFGWYYLTVGLLALPASILFGVLWESVSSKAAFLTGAALAGAALVALLGLRSQPRAA